MTALALRYDTRPGRFRRAATPLDDSRRHRLTELRELIESGEYEIDPEEVAGAILLSARTRATTRLMRSRTS